MRVKQIQWGRTNRASFPNFDLLVRDIGWTTTPWEFFIERENWEESMGSFPTESEAKKAAQDWLEKYVKETFMEETE